MKTYLELWKSQALADARKSQLQDNGVGNARTFAPNEITFTDRRSDPDALVQKINTVTGSMYVVQYEV